MGGDGQEARRGGAAFPTLPAPLAVRVANGGVPVAGAVVRFRPEGAGQVVPADQITDADGLAEVPWTLDPALPAQACRAHLLDAAGSEIPAETVHFHATIEDAAVDGGECCICVGPHGDFATIDDAVGQLLSRGERDLCLCLSAGDHVVEGLALFAKPTDPPFHLSIRGCGRATRVRLKNRWEVEGWASLRLADLDLALPRGVGLLALAVDDVELDDVHVSGLSDDQALVRIHDAARVTVRGCVLAPASAAIVDRLNALFGGLPILEELWAAGEDADDEALRASAAARLGEIPVGDRTAIGEKVQTLAEDGRRRLHAALVLAMTRLAGMLATEPLPADTAVALRRIGFAMAAAFPAVALEIGTRDALQDRIADPVSVRPAHIVVTDNVLVGDIKLYGRHGGAPLKLNERQRLGNWVKAGRLTPGLAGTVHLHGNRLARPLLSLGITAALRDLGVRTARIRCRPSTSRST